MLQKHYNTELNDKKVYNNPKQDLVGKTGENIALNYLKEKDYKLVEKNFSRYEGEIDIIMKDRFTLVFIEVRTRLKGSDTTPEDSIDYRKTAQIDKIAKIYIFIKKIYSACRIDAVCIVLKKDFSVLRLKHYKNITGY